MFPQPNLRDRLAWLPPFLGLLVIVGGLVGMIAFLARERAATVTEADRMQARVVFVRMPGRLDVCVAALRGHRGYGPTFLGASPCSEVRDRIESDEEIAFRLGQLAIVRIAETDACLAHDGDTESFTLPCSGSDD